MRAIFLLFCWLLALAAQGATPEVGKDRLRMLIKLPTVSFPSNWQFDPERGFIVDSGGADVLAQIATLRQEIQKDGADPERYLNIADLYSSINESVKAAHNYERAVELFRKQADTQSEDGVALAKFGRALAGAGRTAEAESVLRRATRIAPKEWECWVALGRVLDAEARRALYDVPAPAPAPDQGDKPADVAVPDKPSADQVAQAKKWMDEAGEVFNKAATIGPDEAEVCFRRGMHRCLRNALFNRIRVASGEQADEVAPLDGCFTVESLADLQHASRLRPKDYRRITATVLFEIYTVSAQKGQVDWTAFSWNSLPDKSQRSIRDAVTRLENLGESPHRKVAAGALEALGILQGPILREPLSCVATLRHALVLDPSRDQAWETLTATLAQSKHYDDLLAACEERVKQKDSARSRVLLAKAYEKLKQWDECEQQIRQALKLDADDFTANLALADLLLKHSQDATTLSDANGWLARAEYLLNKMAAQQRTQLHMIDLTLTRGIYFALTDEVETARRWVKAVIDQDKENKFAQEILDAMGY